VDRVDLLDAVGRPQDRDRMLQRVLGVDVALLDRVRRALARQQAAQEPEVGREVVACVTPRNVRLRSSRSSWPTISQSERSTRMKRRSRPTSAIPIRAFSNAVQRSCSAERSARSLVRRSLSSKLSERHRATWEYRRARRG
jgi:hypothetical protein